MNPIPSDRTVAAPLPAWGLVTFEGAGRGGVPARPAVHRRRRAWRRARPAGRATTRPRAGCWRRLLLWRRAAGRLRGVRGGRPRRDPRASGSRCSCCAPRSRSPTAPAAGRRFGVAGAAARGDAVRAALGEAPAPGHGIGRGRRMDRGRARRPPARACARRCRAEDVLRRLLAHAQARLAGVSGNGCAIGTGVAAGHARHAGPVRAADGELRPGRRRRLPQGLLSRPGDRRAHAVPRTPQGAPARLPRRRATMSRARPRRCTTRRSASRRAAPW